jgi:hypothetical protein
MHFMTLQEAGYAVIGLIVLFSVNLAITGAAQFLERRRFFERRIGKLFIFPAMGLFSGLLDIAIPWFFFVCALWGTISLVYWLLTFMRPNTPN